jgi:hypothetical protein
MFEINIIDVHFCKYLKSRSTHKDYHQDLYQEYYHKDNLN